MRLGDQKALFFRDTHLAEATTSQTSRLKEGVSSRNSNHILDVVVVLWSRRLFDPCRHPPVKNDDNKPGNNNNIRMDDFFFL